MMARRPWRGASRARNHHAYEGNVAAYLRSGALEVLLKDWSLPYADIFAVYQERQQLAAKVRALSISWPSAFRVGP